MSIVKKKKEKVQNNVLDETIRPATLPSYGEGLETFIPSEYPMNKEEVIEAVYQKSEENLIKVIGTCDHNNGGDECDHYVDGQTEHMYAVHDAAITSNESQIIRIRSAREMRKDTLDRNIAEKKEKIQKLKDDIKDYESLRAQFQFHIGRHTFGVGLPITIIAMLVDAALNFSFIENILLSNAFLLAITVVAMSVMSDGAMWALGTLLSHRKEKFTIKPMFIAICASLAMLFALSVVASVLIRFGSMDATFGTINSSGEFVGKESYSLAEYGVTLVTAFLTTATGLLSFAFSLDENAHLVSIRERTKKEISSEEAEVESMKNERKLLDSAPDPEEYDKKRRAAAERQIEATRAGLKQHCRKLLTLHINNPEFTEKMAKSGKEVLADHHVNDRNTKNSNTVDIRDYKKEIEQ